MKLIREYYNDYYKNFDLQIISNINTLNLFSDASMRRRGDILDGCYGSVAVTKDTIIDESIRINSGCTVPAAEIRGLRCSLDLALKHRFEFPNINIFCDSQLAIFGIRDYIYNWYFDPISQRFYTNPKRICDDFLVKNQQLYLECLIMLTDLRTTNNVNIYHQKGHVENNRDLQNAIEVFKRSNGIAGKVEYNLIRYISVYNNYIDDKTRSILLRTNMRDNTFKDAITFEKVKKITNIKFN